MRVQGSQIKVDEQRALGDRPDTRPGPTGTTRVTGKDGTRLDRTPTVPCPNGLSVEDRRSGVEVGARPPFRRVKEERVSSAPFHTFLPSSPEGVGRDGGRPDVGTDRRCLTGLPHGDWREGRELRPGSWVVGCRYRVLKVSDLKVGGADRRPGV